MSSALTTSSPSAERRPARGAHQGDWTITAAASDREQQPQVGGEDAQRRLRAGGEPGEREVEQPARRFGGGEADGERDGHRGGGDHRGHGRRLAR